MTDASMDGKLISVLLVDDQRLIREGLRTLLELHPDLRVVGEAVDGRDAEAAIERVHPRVVLMDLRMPQRDGVTATERIATRWPDIRVLVLTTFDDDDLVFASIEAGAAGYLLKMLAVMRSLKQFGPPPGATRRWSRASLASCCSACGSGRRLETPRRPFMSRSPSGRTRCYACLQPAPAIDRSPTPWRSPKAP
jgi:CheY-like chemotaxis protein